MNLSPTDLAFLRTHGISMSEVFDVGGRSVPSFKDMMKRLGALFAVNASPCQAAGHRIRTRSNHCAICDTARIGYTRRNADPGYVYIEVSNKGRLVKVGMTCDVREREAILNGQLYGGQNDWEIRHRRRCKEAGRHEFLVLKALAAHKAAGSYMKEGRRQECYELFSCTEAQALAEFSRIVPAS